MARQQPLAIGDLFKEKRDRPFWVDWSRKWIFIINKKGKNDHGKLPMVCNFCIF